MNPDFAFRLAFVAIYVLTLAFSSLFLFLSRNHPSITARVPALTQMGILCHVIAFLLFNFDALYGIFPCWVTLLNIMVFVSAWLWTIEGRFLRFWLLYKSSAWNLKWAINPLKREQELRRLKKIRKESGSLSELEANLVQEDARVWFHRHRNLLTNRAILFFVLLMAQITALGAIIIIFNDQDLSPWSKNAYACDIHSWAFYPFYAMTAVNLFLLAVLAVMVRDCNDAYGIRTELYLIIILGVWSFIIFFALNVPEWQAIMGYYFEPGLAVFVGMWLSNLIMVLLPSIRALRQPNRSAIVETGDKQAFMKLLNTPELLEEYKTFSVREFSVENILFHEHWMHFRATLPPNLAPGEALPHRSSKHIRTIYNTFLAPNAHMELNLTSETIKNVRRRFKQGMLNDEHCLDEVEKEIVELMLYSTFPRFLQQRNQLQNYKNKY